MCPRLALNSLHSWQWHWTSGSPASTSPVLGQLECLTMPGFCGAVDWTGDFKHSGEDPPQHQTFIFDRHSLLKASSLLIHNFQLHSSLISLAKQDKIVKYLFPFGFWVAETLFSVYLLAPREVQSGREQLSFSWVSRTVNRFGGSIRDGSYDVKDICCWSQPSLSKDSELT